MVEGPHGTLAFGIPSFRKHVGVTRESAQALANASFGFPQHIRGYLQGADAAIRRHGHLQE